MAQTPVEWVPPPPVHAPPWPAPPAAFPAAPAPRYDEPLAAPVPLATSDAAVMDSRVRPATAFDETTELEARIKQLEDRLAEVEQAAEDPSIVHLTTSDATLVVGARLYLDHWTFPGDSVGFNVIESGDPNISPQDRLEVRRARLSFDGTLPANMVYAADIEYSNGQRLNFRDLYVGWEELPILQTLLIGNQKRPYGLDPLNSSNDNLFMERPFSVEAFNANYRRLGIASLGVSEDQRYNWFFGVYNMRDIQGDGLYASDHYQAELAGRLATTAWYDETSNGRGYLHFAISGSLAHPDSTNLEAPDGVGRAESEAIYSSRAEARMEGRALDTGVIPGAEWMRLAGFESVLNVGPWQLVGEWMHSDVSRGPAFGSDLQFHGGYVYLAYMLTGEHVPWNRRRGTLDGVEPFEEFFLVRTCDGRLGRGLGAWQVAVRYSYADFNDADIFGGYGESVTFALNWWWTANARMQMSYILGEIKDRDVNGGAPIELVSGDYQILGTRFMYFY